MIQHQLFDQGGTNLPAACRAAAREKSNKHSGLMRLVEAAFEIRPQGATADAVAASLDCVLNTARRCVHYLAAEGKLHPIGVGESAYKNPQTIYVHNKYAFNHAEAIKAHAQRAQEPAK
jgi:hypothetical protein